VNRDELSVLIQVPENCFDLDVIQKKEVF